jgi:hypothetical protein
MVETVKKKKRKRRRRRKVELRRVAYLLEELGHLIAICLKSAGNSCGWGR